MNGLRIAGFASAIAAALLLFEAPSAAYSGSGSGYTMTDSDESGGGPVFEWDDISSTGTPVVWPTDPSGDEDQITLTLPFTFTFMGTDYTGATASVCTNGYIEFGGTNVLFDNVPLPTGGAPNAAIMPFWEDLMVNLAGTSECRYQTLGTAPNRRFVISWLDFSYSQELSTSIPWHFTFQVALYEQAGGIRIQYQTMGNDTNTVLRAAGEGATVGIQNAAGSAGLQYLYGDAALVPTITPADNAIHDSLAIGILPSGNTPPWNFVPLPAGPDPNHSEGKDTLCSASAPAGNAGALWPALVLTALLALGRRR